MEHSPASDLPHATGVTQPSGEPGAMSASVETLDRTWAFDEGQAEAARGAAGPNPVTATSPVTAAKPFPGREANGLSFSYASGSKPLAGYTLKRGVGVGGFGEVYFALSDAGKEVALKRIQRNLDIELRGVSHCLNLKHPNLISLYDIRYDDAGQAWIVMEYVAGDSLRQALDRAPQGVSEAEARRWFAALAGGVAHLHEAGIVHRDLKPGNIFDDDGIVKIGDYGLSKYISCSRRGGHTESVGTFHYMAPEVGRGNYGREIDIYAMGIVLFELLTGTVPFDGESSHEIVMKHLTANPDLSAVPEPYRSVIWQALQKNPAARQQTVAQMVRPLGIVLDEHGLARSVSGNLSDSVIDATGSSAFIAGPGNAGSVDAGIQFTSELGTAERPFAARQTRDFGPDGGVRDDGAGNDLHFGEVRHHRPSSVPLAGQFPHRHAGGHQHLVGNQTGGSAVNREEPLARVVRSTFGDVRRWWASLAPFPGTRLVLLVMGVILLILNTQWLVPLLSLLAIFYVPYYIIRAIVLGMSQPTSTQATQQFAGVPRQQPRIMTVKQWRQRRRGELASKRSSVRLAELGGSTSTAVAGCAALATGVGAVALWDQPVTALQVAPFVWSAIVAASSAAAVLLFGKLWEREEGSSFGRRTVMLGAGAAVGAASFQLANFLMLPIGEGLERDIDATSLPLAFYQDGTPMMAAMMAHFALLLAGLRWWKVADPLRRVRVSVWGVAVAVVGAWALHQILPIPQPYGMLTAGLISIAVQLAAPWENPKQRFADPATQPVQIA
ncbi:serine/threonine-protein kinase [Planctomycetaceae bacterium SH139]